MYVMVGELLVSAQFHVVLLRKILHKSVLQLVQIQRLQTLIENKMATAMPMA